MANGLSSQSEQYLDQVVATGLFPSKEAALEAAVVALREKNDQIPFIPDEHMDRVEQAIKSADAGLCQPMTEADWSRLRASARQAATEGRGSQ